MRTFIGGSFITTFLVITIFSAPAAIDPNMILYYSFDELDRWQGRSQT